MALLSLAPGAWKPLLVGVAAAVVIGTGVVALGPFGGAPAVGPLGPSGATSTQSGSPLGPSANATENAGGDWEAAFASEFPRPPVSDTGAGTTRPTSPATRESWHTPRLFTGAAEGFYDPDAGKPGSSSALVELGTRDGAPIVAEIYAGAPRGDSPRPEDGHYEGGYFTGLYEIHDGRAYYVKCPSAYGECWSGEPFATYWTDAVYYDTLSFPTTMTMFGDATLNTTWVSYDGEGPLDAAAPDWYTTPSTASRTPIDTAFGATIYRVDRPSEIPGLDNSSFELATRAGLGIEFYGSSLDGWFAGWETWGYFGERATAFFCEELGGPTFYTREQHHVSSDWVAVADGLVPAPGGNEVAQAIFDVMSARAGAAYPYANFEAFLAGDSVRARPMADGQWTVLVSPTAFALRPEDADSICD